LIVICSFLILFDIMYTDFVRLYVNADKMNSLHFFAPMFDLLCSFSLLLLHLLTSFLCVLAGFPWMLPVAVLWRAEDFIWKPLIY
jgi:hypothetical protein